MTKRLFAYIGLTMLVTFSVVFYFGFYASLFAVAFSACLLFAAILIKKLRDNRRVLILIAAVILLSNIWFGIYNSLSELKTERYDGTHAKISGTLTNYHTAYDNYYYELDCNKIDDEDVSFRIVLNTSADLGAETGDIITLNALLKKPENNYYKSRGIDFNARCKGYSFDYTVQTPKDFNLKLIPAVIRDALTLNISALIPGYEGELCNAISLGDKYALSPELYKAFSSTGLSYLIVVSGMHMSIVAGYIVILTRLLKRFRGGAVIRNILVIAAVILYMAVTGFSSSATRAGIMIIVMYLGYIFSQNYEPFNSLGFAAFILTVGNPLAVGDVGMLMSFSSVAGILFLLPRFMERFDLKFSKGIKNKYFLYFNAKSRIDKARIKFNIIVIKILRYVYEMFMMSVCAVLAISPITMMFFGICNLFVVFYSVLLMPVTGFLIMLSLLTAVLFLVPFTKIFAFGTAFFTRAIASYVVFAVNSISQVPFMTFYARQEDMRLWFIVTAVLIVIALLFKKRRITVALAAVLSVVVLCTNIGIASVVNADKEELRVYDSGYGMFVSYKSPYGVNVLCCGGNAYLYEDIAEKLHLDGNKINMLIVPEAREKREMGYAYDILTEFDVERVLVYYRYNSSERVYRKARECASFARFKENTSAKVKLSDNVTDKIINTGNHSWQYISNGELSVLIAPYKGNAAKLPEKYKSADYLIYCGKVYNLDDLSCGEVIQASDGSCDDNMQNVSLIDESGEFIIDFD